MAISHVGAKYRVLPPIIRPDLDEILGKSRASTVGTAIVPSATSVVSASNAAFVYAIVGRHLLRIVG